LLHQRAPGYLPNKKQQRFAGLATIHAAQVLRKYWIQRKNVLVNGKSSTQKDGKDHTFGWRDLYDIIIIWRQVSEPNDPVWWVDLLTEEQFTEGFGSHTPMVVGQCNVVRYSPMVEMSFPIMKEETINQRNLSENLKQQVREAKTLLELYEVIKRDYWIVTPCHSLRTGKILDGTRLTLQCFPPDGVEFSIRTPGTPPRWVDYDLELKYIFDLLTEEIIKEQMNLDRVSDLILTLTFYWYNFMPLSRGTAACGYVGLVAMFLSIGIHISDLVPELVLVDWEGILRPKPQDFIDSISPWLYEQRQKINMTEFDNLPDMYETIPTLRNMIEIMNCEIY